MRVVIDTNTVLALWMFKDPALHRLARAIEDGRMVPLTRADALTELRLVLAYRQFGLDLERQSALHATYAARALAVPEQPVDHAPPLPKCRDSDDQKFLEIARDGAATYLITRDKALLRLNRHRLVRTLFSIATPEVLAPDA